MNEKILYDVKARKELEKGIDIIFAVISSTLGPTGKNVLLQYSSGSCEIVNSGAKIAREIQLEDEFQNIGASLIRQVASKTYYTVGDGVTTAVVLAYSIIKQGLQVRYSGVDPVSIKQGIRKALYFLIDKIADYAKPVEEIKDLACIASMAAGCNSQIGSIVARAICMTANKGLITIEKTNSPGIRLDLVEGIKFDIRSLSPDIFSMISEKEVVQYNPYILVTDQKITCVNKEIVPILEQVSKTGRPLLLVIDSIERQALSTLVVNYLKKVVNVFAIKIPGFLDQKKEFLYDFAFLTGSDIISYETGRTLRSASLSMMGSAERVIISENSILLTPSDSEKKLVLSSQLKKQIEKTSGCYEREKLRTRLNNLSGQIALIRVGGSDDSERDCLKSDLEVSIRATKLAIREGVVPGGGATFLHLSTSLISWSKSILSFEERSGALLLAKALYAPAGNIIKNSGLDTNISSVLEKMRDNGFGYGYDVLSDQIVNMYTHGIVDSAQVLRSSLQNAVSIASLVLITECVICCN
uniref:Chaperonin GroEL n=1 Tax=Neogoniolithon spectabile TaxID=231755 RepID=A0A3G3MGM5_9FLOR|nr:chaperonin GroEL [Neogoniolithon spectabile]AYR05980.1 chaperonin GroEL [Neogoniolithon spectabile]